MSAHSLPTFKNQAVRLGVHREELVIDAFLVGSLMKGRSFVDDFAMWHYSDSGEWPVESRPELLAEVAAKFPASRQGFSPPSTPTSASSSLLDAAQDAGVLMSPDQYPSGSVAVESEDDCILVRSVTTNHPPPSVSDDYSYQHHIWRYLNSHALQAMKHEPVVVPDSPGPCLAPEVSEPVVIFSPVVHSAGPDGADSVALPVVAVPASTCGAPIVTGSLVDSSSVGFSSISRFSVGSSTEVSQVLLLPDAGLVCSSPPGVQPMPFLPGGHCSVLSTFAASADLSAFCDSQGLLDPESCFCDPVSSVFGAVLSADEAPEVVVPVDSLRFFQPSSSLSLELSASSMLSGLMSWASKDLLGAAYAEESKARLLSTAGTYVEVGISRIVSSKHVMVRAKVRSRRGFWAFPFLASVDRLCSFDADLVGASVECPVPFQGDAVFESRPAALSGALPIFALDAHNYLIYSNSEASFVDLTGVITAFVPLLWILRQWLAEELFQYSAEPLVVPSSHVGISSVLVVDMVLPLTLPTPSVFFKAAGSCGYSCCGLPASHCGQPKVPSMEVVSTRRWLLRFCHRWIMFTLSSLSLVMSWWTLLGILIIFSLL